MNKDKPGISSRAPNVQFRKLLHFVLKSCEHDLGEVFLNYKYPIIQKKMLVRKLDISAIRLARFVVLYRWKKQANRINSSPQFTSIYDSSLYSSIEMLEDIYQTIENTRISSYMYRNSEMNDIHRNNQNKLFFSNKFLRKPVLCILDNYNLPRRVNSVVRRGTTMTISAYPEYIYTLKIDPCLKLKDFKLLWREKNVSVSFFRILCLHAKDIINRRSNLITELDKLFHRFYLIGDLFSIYLQLSNLIEILMMQITKIDNKIIIFFPNRIKFQIEIWCDQIYLVSMVPGWKYCRVVTSFSIKSEIFNLIPLIQRYRLAQITYLLDSAILQAPNFNFIIQGQEIIMNLCSMPIFRIFFEKFTAEICITFTSNYDFREDLLINPIKQLNSINLGNNLLKLESCMIYNSILGFKAALIPIWEFEFFFNIFLKSDYKLGYTRSLKCLLQDSRYYGKIIYDSIDMLLVRQNVKQFIDYLEEIGSEYYENMYKLEFGFYPFENLKISFYSSSIFSISVKKININFDADKSHIFIHNKRSILRCNSYIMNILNIISSYIKVSRQVNFVVGRAKDQPTLIQPNLFHSIFKLAPNTYFIAIKILSIIDHDLGCYEVTPSSPEIKIIPYSIPSLLKHMPTITNKNGFEYLLSSFLSSTFLQIQAFYKVFCKYPDDDFLTTNIRNDGSFYLVYKKKYSLNVTFKPSQVFQIIIPSIGPSMLLQIPTSRFSRFRKPTTTRQRPQSAPHLTHASLILTVDQLQEFKNSIEWFFTDRDKLSNLKFSKFKYVADKIILECRAPLPTPYWISLDSQINKDGITLSVLRIDETKNYLKTIDAIFKMKFSTRDLVYKMLDFMMAAIQMKGPLAVKFFNCIWMLINSPLSASVDWEKAFDRSSVLEDRSTISFQLVLKDGHNFMIHITECSNNAENVVIYHSQGVVASVTNLAELTNWLMNIKSFIPT